MAYREQPAHAGFLSMDASAPAHVLVLDPDPSIRALLVAVLRRSSMRVTACGDDRDGADRLLRGRYAAVIISADMPRVDTLLDQLRLRSDRPKIIVTTTPHVLPLAMHADVVLWKPFLLEHLQSAIAACCTDGVVEAQA